MKILDAVADIFAMPDTWQQAMQRYFVALVIMIGTVMLDERLHTCAPAFIAGYIIGGLVMYGNLHKHKRG